MEEVTNKAGLSRESLIGIGVGLLIIGFLLGFLPMWQKAGSAERAVARAENRLALVELENALALAAITATRGGYEPARQQASAFYSELSQALNRADNPVFTPEQREKLRGVQAQRDEMITLLARNDPASAERLVSLYLTFREIVTPAPVNPPGAPTKK